MINHNTNNKHLKAIHAKGFSGKSAAERWGISRQHLGNQLKKPKKMFLDAIEGLPTKVP